MGIINVLDISVANLIAAGEVVERPANAVKELVENAIDAGASSVTVEIVKGGVRLLRVTDDGCGMSNEDAVIAIRRHATSKLRTAEDLSAIMTLGFRGEALAAITAISEFRILTKRRDDEEGTLLSGKYGAVETVKPEGCPDGTTIICENLFAATSARLKFLKSDATETAAVASVVEKLAVSRPEIAIRLITDGLLKFSTRGDGNLKNAIYSVYGGAFAKNLVPVQFTMNGIEVTGFTSAPDQLRGNRALQQFFINERCVRSKTLTAALEAAYRSYTPTGKFPSCVMNLKISAALVDVNIHPAKLEVKFSDEKAVFDAVFAATRNALLKDLARPSLDLAEIAEKKEKQEKLDDLFSKAYEKGKDSEEKTESAPVVSTPVSEERPITQSVREEISTVQTDFEKLPESKPISEELAKTERQQIRLTFHEDDLPVDIPILPREMPVSPMSNSRFEELRRLSSPAVPVSEPEKQVSPTVIPIQEEFPKIQTDAKIPKMESNPVPPYRMIGEAFASYILLELDDKLILVDKHAAHERINFERLRANMQTDVPYIQMILVPETLAFSAEELALVKEYEKELQACGFAFSVDDQHITMNGIPFGFEKDDAVSLFISLIAEAEKGIPVDQGRQNAFEEMLYQSSCKASVKAGRVYDTAHLRWICDNLFRYDCIKFCPHGRPVAFELSKKELDTRFGRT